MIAPEMIARHKIMYIGDTFRNDVAMRVSPAVVQAAGDLQDFFAIDMTGAAISDTTTGRIPMKILTTTGLSMKLVKIAAMARIARKEGRILPRVAAMLPFTPLIL